MANMTGWSASQDSIGPGLANFIYRLPIFAFCSVD